MGSVAQRQISIVVSILVTFLLTYHIIYSLSQLATTVSPEIYLSRIALSLAFFFLPILGAWVSFRFVGGVLFTLYASVLVFFVSSISSSPAFIWFLLDYAALCYFLIRLDQEFEDQIATANVNFEQQQNKKNDLDVVYRSKGESISILFEKYSTYYRLRLLAEELSTILSVSQLSMIAVGRAFEFIPRGDAVLITLADSEAKHLTVQAAATADSKSNKKVEMKHPNGDLFDLWVVKNRRSLFINDTHQDFRFDVKEVAQRGSLRSLIIAPLLHEGRAMGTLRINSKRVETFSNDDLRLLDTISVLTSSGLSNATLYERTEELAIRDSLTDLYVRRYFFERLKEEHRRALIGKRPLTVLMCDLDHFKECNNRYGHGAGDLMLAHFAKILRASFQHGVVARYGGEEFCVFLPETSKQDGMAAAEKLRQNVEKEPFTIRREKLGMTVSVGVANCPEDTLEHETLVQMADQALYQAKRAGRNQVCSAEV